MCMYVYNTDVLYEFDLESQLRISREPNNMLVCMCVYRYVGLVFFQPAGRLVKFHGMYIFLWFSCVCGLLRDSSVCVFRMLPYVRINRMKVNWFERQFFVSDGTAGKKWGLAQ